ncbi:MAG: response regulator [Myxococcota bacterium]
MGERDDLPGDLDLAVDAFRRELAFAVDAEGRITRLGGGGLRLGLGLGDPVASAALFDTADKLARFLERARVEPTRDWELCLRVDGRPMTVSCSGLPHGDGVAVLATTLPEDHQSSLRALSSSIDEITTLNRHISSQNRDLAQLNTDLSESNAGIMALHTEIEERANSAATEAEIKRRLVAEVGHEFRTPIHSILGLTRLLLDRTDGDLTQEQERQVRFLRSAAEELSLMVEDLLDLSRLDAGAFPLRQSQFQLDDLLGELRGLLRPLTVDRPGVELHIDSPSAAITLDTDRIKLGQIVRNLVSNALKFTDAGEVRVRSRLEGERLVMEVSDTGIGIAEEHQGRIFEEFARLSPGRPGTGLGLPLAQRLARLLGGDIEVKSAVGVGSTFTISIPRVHEEVIRLREMEHRAATDDRNRPRILVVEDDRKSLFVYERYLDLHGFQAIPVRDLPTARRVLERERPAAIVLDVMLENDTSWAFLNEVKQHEAYRDIPVLVVTVVGREREARALGADEFWLKPLDHERLLRRLDQLVRERAPKILMIDDDSRARYLLAKHLEGTRWALVEAETGQEGLDVARQQSPNVILLDFVLPDLTAFDVLDELKADPRTRQIPVIVHTARQLAQDEVDRLNQSCQGVMLKQHLSQELAIHRIRDALAQAQSHATGDA